MVRGLARALIFIGLMVAAMGVLIHFADKLPLRLGRLPGDIVWRGKNTTFYFPLTTLILLNGALALVLWLFQRR